MGAPYPCSQGYLQPCCCYVTVVPGSARSESRLGSSLSNLTVGCALSSRSLQLACSDCCGSSLMMPYCYRAESKITGSALQAAEGKAMSSMGYRHGAGSEQQHSGLCTLKHAFATTLTVKSEALCLNSASICSYIRVLSEWMSRPTLNSVLDLA